MKSIYRVAIISISLLLTACDGNDQPPKNSAAVCFNPNLYQKGNHYSMLDTAKKSVSIIFHTTMLGSTQFEGKKVWQMQNQMVVKQAANASPVKYPARTLYYQLDQDQYVENELARKTLSGGETLIYHNQPIKQQKFNLQPGQSYSQAYSMVLTSPKKKRKSVKSHTTFMGMEKQTVPAGKFDTCHFKIDMTSSEDGDSHLDLWLAKGLGIPVRLHSHAYNADMQLTKAHIGKQDFPTK